MKIRDGMQACGGTGNIKALCECSDDGQLAP
jgi:phosphotransferase system IIB component